MPNISNTDADRRLMLDKIGAKTFEELLDRIPEDLRLKRELNIPALSEMELLRELQTLANKNTTGMACFAGGGVFTLRKAKLPFLTIYIRVDD
ncbi:MAG: hypothetical protein KKA42_10835, partial [candidate division Zixibacteria bacterium]|nr:hypothetical protein [candidate division Zixibacteria bacterium]